MRNIVIAAALAASVGAPAFAQMEVTCGDYSIMDNAQQMETIAALESEASQMSAEQNLTADAMHEKLAADCEGQGRCPRHRRDQGLVASRAPGAAARRRAPRPMTPAPPIGLHLPLLDFEKRAFSRVNIVLDQGRKT